MFDINGGEFLVLGAVAIVVLGPERLPTYAAQLGTWVREARTFARNAREQVRSEMGEDFDDINWQALDPRRYDPRRIVRDALLEDDVSPGGVSDSAPHVPAAMRPDAGGTIDDVAPTRAHGATAAGADGTVADGTGAHTAARARPAYDDDAT